MCRGPALDSYVVTGPTARLVWHSCDFVIDRCLPIWTVAWPEIPTHSPLLGAAGTVPILLEWGDLSHPQPITPPIKTYALSSGPPCSVAGMFVLK